MSNIRENPSVCRRIIAPRRTDGRRKANRSNFCCERAKKQRAVSQVWRHRSTKHGEWTFSYFKLNLNLIAVSFSHNWVFFFCPPPPPRCVIERRVEGRDSSESSYTTLILSAGFPLIQINFHFCVSIRNWDSLIQFIIRWMTPESPHTMMMVKFTILHFRSLQDYCPRRTLVRTSVWMDLCF
jgi:hypothetical protein